MIIPILLMAPLLAQARQPDNFKSVMGDTCATLQRQNQQSSADMPKSQNLCELTRDNNKAYAEKELKWYGCDKAELSKSQACAGPRKTIANLNNEYQKCKAERAKQEQELADQKKNVEKLCKDQQPQAKNAAVTAQNEVRAQQIAKFQADLQKQQDEIRETAAAIQKMNDAMAAAQRDLEAGRAQHDQAIEQMRQAVDEGVKDITYKPQSGEDAQKLAAVGGPSQSVDDLLNSGPPETPEGQGSCFEQVTHDAPDPQCGEDMRKVFFSCRVPNLPPNAESCESLDTHGSGLTCLGMVACCVNIREQKLIEKATLQCPIRRCMACPVGRKSECDDVPPAKCDPIPKEDWPSVRSCAVARLEAPSAPSRLWTDADCNGYLKNIDGIAAKADKQHQEAVRLRKEWEAVGDPMKCPDGCGHGQQFIGIADQFEKERKYIQAELGRELQLKRGCDTHLKQADLEAMYVAGQIKHLASFITDWNPDEKKNARGPYYIWSIAGDSRLYNPNNGAGLCAALLDYERCVSHQ